MSNETGNSKTMTDEEVRDVVRARRQHSAPEPLSRRDIYITRFAVGAAVAGVAIKTGLLSVAGGIPRDIESGVRSLLNGSNTPGKINYNGDAPTATMDYLKTLQTEQGTIPAGAHGVDDAAYEVDSDTFTESADIKAGVEEFIDEEVPHTAAGVPVPQGDEKVDVPVVPPLSQVPPDAR